VNATEKSVFNGIASAPSTRFLIPIVVWKLPDISRCMDTHFGALAINEVQSKKLVGKYLLFRKIKSLLVKISFI